MFTRVLPGPQLSVLFTLQLLVYVAGEVVSTVPLIAVTANFGASAVSVSSVIARSTGQFATDA